MSFPRFGIAVNAKKITLLKPQPFTSIFIVILTENIGL